jgi:hypothetical protein
MTLDSPATYFHVFFMIISMPNLLLIAGMVVLFAAALLVPFPHPGADRGRRP